MRQNNIKKGRPPRGRDFPLFMLRLFKRNNRRMRSKRIKPGELDAIRDLCRNGPCRDGYTNIRASRYVHKSGRRFGIIRLSIKFEGGMSLLLNDVEREELVEWWINDGTPRWKAERIVRQPDYYVRQVRP